MPRWRRVAGMLSIPPFAHPHRAAQPSAVTTVGASTRPALCPLTISPPAKARPGARTVSLHEPVNNSSHGRHDLPARLFPPQMYDAPDHVVTPTRGCPTCAIIAANMKHNCSGPKGSLALPEEILKVKKSLHRSAHCPYFTFQKLRRDHLETFTKPNSQPRKKRKHRDSTRRNAT